MVEKIFAGIMVAACVVLLARMLIAPGRRRAIDEAVGQRVASWRRRLARAAALPSAHARAHREASEAIRRARRSATDREGNVYRPDAFNGKHRRDHQGKRRDLH